MKVARIIAVGLIVIVLSAAFGPAASVAEASTIWSSTPSESMSTMPTGYNMSILSGMIDPLANKVDNSLFSGKSGYSCSVVSQSPQDWTVMHRRQSFDLKWVIRNTGKTWQVGSVDLKFLGGTKMQTGGSLYDVSQTVGKGGKVTFLLDMMSPKNKGFYSTTWGLVTGANAKPFCWFSLSLTVVN